MTNFAYRGLDGQGRPVRGRRAARDETHMRDLLLGEQITPLAITRSGHLGGDWGASGSGGLKLDDASAAGLATDLARFMRSGLSLGQALQLIETGSDQPRQARLARRLHEDLLRGLSLSAALEAAPGRTGRFLQALARAGETTGRLHEILAGGAVALRAQAGLKRRLLTLVLYPLFVLFMATAAMALFAIVVLPALEPAFNSVGNLPASTRAVLTGGAILRAAAPYVGLALAAAALAIAGLAPVRRVVLEAGERLLLSRLGAGILADALFASLAQRLSIALLAGVPTVSAYRVSVMAIGVNAVRRPLEAQDPRLAEGARLSDALAASPHAPALLLNLTRVGEQAQDLPRVLGEAATTLSERAHERTERLLSLLTPAIVLLIGLLVGGVVLVIFQGLLSISAGVEP